MKTFDTLEMKRHAQEALRRELDGLSEEQRREYWDRAYAKLLTWQRELRGQSGHARAGESGAATR